MPLSLTNESLVFQHMASNIFQDFLDILNIIYLDDILIFFETQGEQDLCVDFYGNHENMVSTPSSRSVVLIAIK